MRRRPDFGTLLFVAAALLVVYLVAGIKVWWLP